MLLFLGGNHEAGWGIAMQRMQAFRLNALPISLTPIYTLYQRCDICQSLKFNYFEKKNSRGEPYRFILGWEIMVRGLMGEGALFDVLTAKYKYVFIIVPT
jgi:hypothetical protein